MATNPDLTTLYGAILTGVNNPATATGGSVWQPTPILNAASADLTNPNNLLEPALLGTLDWMQVAKNMASTQTGVANIPETPVTDIRNEAVNIEKQRILNQKNSQESTREDAFTIGTVCLTIPPTQISISEEKHNFRYKMLRSSSDVITTSGRSTMRIDLEVIFNGIDDVNNKLRPLLAQFKCTPFLPINNEYVKSIVSPGLNSEEQEAVANKESDSNNPASQINTIQSYSATALSNIVSQINSLQTMGAINTVQTSQALSIINQWYGSGNSSVLLLVGPYVNTSPTDGSITFDLKSYIYSLIETSGNVIPSDQVVNLAQIMNSLGSTSSSIDNNSKSVSNIVDNNITQRYVDKQIVGALSQFTVSTIPGFPESLSARISMYIFNYDPYSYDFSYVKGYDPAQYTPSITECDIFIDWYSNRFLSAMNQGNALGVYTEDDSLEFRYLDSITYSDLIAGNQNPAGAKSVILDEETSVVGISVTMRNIINFIPVLSGAMPTCQYMGAYGSSIQIQLNSTNMSKVREIKTMIDTISKISRKDNRLGRYYVFQVNNSLINLFGSKYFSIETFSTSTVPGSPGLSSISIELSEVRTDQEKLQTLERALTTTNTSVLAAAQYIINSARAYALDTTPGHSQTSNLANWYNFCFGPGNSPLSGTLMTCIRQAVNGDISGYYPDYGSSSQCKAEINKINGGGVLGGASGTWGKIQSIAGKGAAQGGGSTSTSYSSVPGNENLNSYIFNLMSVFNGGTGKFVNGNVPMDWDSESEFAAYALASGDFENIAALLNPSSVGNPDLLSAVTGQALSSVGGSAAMVDSTCYPDLALPTYSSLGSNGTAFKLTYADVGLITPDIRMQNQPAQTDYVSIEPDAFFKKISLSNIMDSAGSPGMEAGLNNFINMSQNSLLSSASPEDSSVFMDKVRKAYESNDVSYGVGPSISNSLLDQANGVTYPNNGTPNTSSDGINGKPCTVTQVLDANTVLVKGPSGKQYAIRIVDYQPSPDGNSSANQTSPNVNSPNFKIANRVLLNSTIVPTILKTKVVNQYGFYILLASVTISGGNAYTTMKNAGMQLDSSSDSIESDISNSSNSSIPQQDQSQDLPSIFGEKSWLIRNSTKTPVLSKVATSATTVPSTSSVVNNGEAETKGVSIQGSLLLQQDPVTNRFIYPAWLLNLEKDNVNSNNNYNRWDRYSMDHINAIADRIRYQSKDNTLRMVKAFPTFKFYFVDEPSMEYVPLSFIFHNQIRNPEEQYIYGAVVSIDISSSRKEAADTAVIVIANTKGALDRSRFGLHDPSSNNTQRGPMNSNNVNDKNTINQSEPMDEFILKAGTRIRIKLGYCSDPTFLDNVFTGQVSEVTMGDFVTIVAQGYGTELMNPIVGWGNRKYQAYSAYKLLDDIMHREEITHFGFAEWSSINNQAIRRLHRRISPQSGTYGTDIYHSYNQPSAWRDWLGIGWLLSHSTNQSANNINTTEHSDDQDFYNGQAWEFQTENRTAWDIFQEMTRRYPGSIAQVLPFDNRATIYFGLPDGLYSYSNEVAALVGETRTSLEDRQGQLDNAINSGTITPVSNDQVSSMINRVNSLVNQASAAENWTIGQQPSTPSTFYFSTAPNASWILQQTQIWLATQKSSPTYSSDTNLINSFRTMAENQGLNSVGMNAGNINFTPGGSVQLFSGLSNSTNVDNPLYVTNGGVVTDKNTYLSNIAQFSTNAPANMKMLRSYHYYDSLRNIISNNITASSEEMWNKSVVITNNRLNWIGDMLHTHTANGYEYTFAQANDNIWKEKIKTKVSNEPNAGTSQIGWQYALGTLKYGMNEMYQGSLTVLGDPTVKPNDVVFMNDYYTDMNGPFEVREVNHHFGHDTGFVTTIVPDLSTYINNSLTVGSDAFAGGMYDDIANAVLMGHNVKVTPSNKITNGSLFSAANGTQGTPALDGSNSSPATAPANSSASRYSNYSINRTPFIRAATASRSESTVLSGATSAVADKDPFLLKIPKYIFGQTGIPGAVNEMVSGLQFAVGGWSMDRREPIGFTPLIYAGRPYVAGIEGWRVSDWYEPGIDKALQYIYYVQNSPKYIGQTIQKALNAGLSNAS